MKRVITAASSVASERLDRIVDILGLEETYDEIVRALSTDEANEIADYIEEVYDIAPLDDDEEEDYYEEED